MSSDPSVPAAAPPAGATAMPPAPDPATTAAGAPDGRRCQNCAAPLLGEHCYACGQPTKGLVRHFGSILGDFFDSVFELDSRILRTLGPLLFRPGYLSTEYFAGRRVRYVSPVRLFVFLSLFAFFAAQFGFSIAPDGSDAPAASGAGPADDDTPDVTFGGDAGVGMRLRNAATAAEVEAIRDEAIAALGEARERAGGLPGVGAGLDLAEREVRADAQNRLAAIRRESIEAMATEPLATDDPAPAPAPDAPASGPASAGAPPDGAPPASEAPPADAVATDAPAIPDRKRDGPSISFGGDRKWDPDTNPLVFDWLPEAFNRKLNESVGRAQDNLTQIEDDPDRLKDAFLSTVPTTLFVLLPLFAVLLKLAYAFRRRLYMEHLIVALHSHSFLCAALLLAIVFDTIKAWTPGVVSGVFQLLEIVTIAWMPLYLLLMQKRVYGQGWIMTLLKFGVLGMCYLFLIVWGAVASLMISLVSM